MGDVIHLACRSTHLLNMLVRPRNMSLRSLALPCLACLGGGLSMRGLGRCRVDIHCDLDLRLASLSDPRNRSTNEISISWESDDKAFVSPRRCFTGSSDNWAMSKASECRESSVPESPRLSKKWLVVTPKNCARPCITVADGARRTPVRS